jgi:adenylate cyclase
MLLGSLLVVGSWVGFCIWSFNHYGWQMPMVSVIVAALLTQLLLGIYRFWQESSKRRWIEGLFGRYVSPPVLKHLINTPGAVDIGGTRQTITVLFSDICGFTKFSEHLEPEQVTNLLNDYLESMVRIIFFHGGTVDKFIGDGIMAIWNWPVGQPDHTLRAVQAAIEMDKEVHQLSTRWGVEDLVASTSDPGSSEPLGIRIGIHTGLAVVGNIGSTQRMEQTAIGDTVNVASRLEAIGKDKQIAEQFGSSIVISEVVQQALPPDQGFTIVPIGETDIRGRTQALQLYVIIGQQL